MERKEILILGAGNIGRGVMGSLFYEAGYRLTFYDAVPALTQGLARQGRYTVERTDGETVESLQVAGFDVIQAEDEEGLLAALEGAELAACCVYSGAFDALCGQLARIIPRRAAVDAPPLNLLLCVNELGAVSYFHSRIGGLLETEAARTYFRERVALCQALVLRAGMPSSDEARRRDPYAVTTSPDGHVFVDGEAFLGPKPQLEWVRFVDRIGARMERKVYTGNMLHCAQAFLGAYRGGKDMAACRAFPGVLEDALGAYREAEEALAREYGFSSEDRQEWDREVLGDLVGPDGELRRGSGAPDPVSRILARPMEKLGRTGRFIAPALLCVKNGVLPFFLTKGIACGLCYHAPEDPQSEKMREILNEKGVDGALEEVCGLEGGDWILKGLIRGHYRQLTQGN